MDEEIMDMITEEQLEPVNVSIVKVDVDIDDEEPSITTTETVETVIVEQVEEIEIEVDEAIGWAGGDNERHYSLLGRDDPNQHTIGAITGLREELDEIERIKTVYSDKFNVANYYEWDNVTYSDYGCFVSIVPNTSKIKICDGLDILGVSVPSAGFVGGQNQDAPRGNSYGLIMTSGLVDVRCESDVQVGDYVVSNIRGWAKKSESNYGYRVLAKENKDGPEHVVILLGVQADKTNAIGEDLDALEQRVEVNEKNIISAINVANQAYNKAVSSEDSVTASKDDIEEALREILGFGETIDEMEKTVASSSLVSAQAKAIADSAVAAAISMRDEAVKNANKALGNTVELREELKDTTTKMNKDLNIAVLDLKDLKEDLTPLATWPEGSDINNSIGYAGFVARADENSSILGTMVGRKGDDGETLAGFIQEAEETRATVRSIVSYEYKDKNGNPVTGAAGLMAQVDDIKSEVSAVANRSFTKEDGTVVTGLAGLTAQVDENESNVSLVANRVADKYTVIPEVVAEDKRNPSKIYSSYDKDSNTTTYYYKNGAWTTTTTWSDLSLKTSMIYYVAANKLYWYYKNNAWTFTTDAHIAGLPASIAGIQVIADDNSSSINSLTSWQGTTKTAMARIEQKADANGAYIQSTVANLDRYSVGPHSQAYGFTLEQAGSILEEGMIYVPTVSVIEEYSYIDTSKKTQTYKRTFTPQYLYKWGKVSGQYRWITVDKNYNETTETNTSSKAVYFTTAVPAVSGNFGYWYTNGNSVASGYDPHTLYKWESYEDEDGTTKYQWVAVATLAGNSQSRAVSQIRQDANSIEMSVTALDGKYAGTKMWVDENSSNIQDVVSWKGENAESIATFMATAGDNFASTSQVAKIVDEDGNIKAASIVTAVTEDESSIALLADNIVLDADQINFTAGNFGGRNLLLDSGTEVTNSSYPTKTYYLSETPVVRETYTLTLSGSLGEGKTHFAAYNSGDKVWMTQLKRVGNSSIYTSTFEWINKSGNNVGADTHVNIYPMPNSSATSTIHWVKLEKGSVSTDWSPAPEDQVPAKQASTGMSWKMIPDKCVWWNSNTSETSPLMRLNNDGLYIKGEIEATSGRIGNSTTGFSISSSAIRNEINTPNGGTVTKLYMQDCTALNVTVLPDELLENYLLEDEKNIKDEYKYYVYVGTDGIGTYTISEINVGMNNIEKYYRTYMKNGQLYSDYSTIAGWLMTDNAISKGTPGATGSFYISHTGRNINNFFVSKASWALTIGQNFGVTTAGNVYISKLNASSTLWVGASSYTPSSNVTIGKYTTNNWAFLSNVSYDNSNKTYNALVGIDSNGYMYCSKAVRVGNVDNNFNTHLSYQQLSFKNGNVEVGTLTTLYLSSSNEYRVQMNGHWELDRLNSTSPNAYIKIGSYGSIINSAGADVIISDRNFKNNISIPSEKYDVFFDNLIPSTFQYNEGTSGRLHSGFIAQEVGAALEKAELSTKEFAGYVDCNGYDMDNLGLRYEEFISLNTWQIQKLKARVAELENKITQLTSNS